MPTSLYSWCHISSSVDSALNYWERSRQTLLVFPLSRYTIYATTANFFLFFAINGHQQQPKMKNSFQGFDQGDGTSIELISKVIEQHLKIPCYVLMGANLANEVADEKFCETTIGINYYIVTINNIKEMN